MATGVKVQLRRLNASPPYLSEPSKGNFVWTSTPSYIGASITAPNETGLYRHYGSWELVLPAGKVFEGFSADTTYTVKSIAVNAVGREEKSSDIETVNFTWDILPPGPPYNVLISRSGLVLDHDGNSYFTNSTSGFTLNWNKSGSSDVAKQKVYAYQTDSDTNLAGGFPTEILVNVSSYALPGPYSNGHRYKFAVTAVDTLGQESSVNNYPVRLVVDQDTPNYGRIYINGDNGTSTVYTHHRDKSNLIQILAQDDGRNGTYSPIKKISLAANSPIDMWPLLPQWDFAQLSADTSTPPVYITSPQFFGASTAGAGDGDKVIQFYADDMAGNQGSFNRHIYFDTQAPEAPQITQPGSIAKTIPQIAGTARDLTKDTMNTGGSGIKTVKVRVRKVDSSQQPTRYYYWETYGPPGSTVERWSPNPTDNRDWNGVGEAGFNQPLTTIWHSVASFTPATSVSWSIPFPANLSLAEGEKIEVDVRAWDRADNPKDWLNNVVTIDQLGPSGNISLKVKQANGFYGPWNGLSAGDPNVIIDVSGVHDNKTQDQNITYKINGTNVDRIGQDTDWNTPHLHWTLPSGGAQTITVQAYDQYGNSTTLPVISIMLDGAPPQGSFIINDGYAFTGEASVTLNLKAKDPAPGSGLSNEVYVRSENDIISTRKTVSAWVDIDADGSQEAATTWTFHNIISELKTVTVIFKDNAGNTSEASRSVTFDWTPPNPSTVEGITYNGSYAPIGSISGQASDALSGIKKVYIAINKYGTSDYWNGTAWETRASSTDYKWLEASGTQAWTYTISNPAVCWGGGGNFWLYVRAVDNVNKETTQILDQGSSKTSLYFTVNASVTISFPLAVGTNWVSLPVKNSGLNTINDVGNSLLGPHPSPALNDTLSLSVYNNQDKTTKTWQAVYNGSIWIKNNISDPVYVGEMFVVSVKKAYTWSVTGETPVPADINFNFVKDATLGNMNWASVPLYKTGITDTKLLADSIGANLNKQTGNVMSITARDNASQQEITDQFLWNGSIWSKSGSPQTLNPAQGQPFKVTVPSSTTSPWK